MHRAGSASLFVIITLGVFALLVLWGITDSAKTALAIFVFHMYDIFMFTPYDKTKCHTHTHMSTRTHLVCLLNHGHPKPTSGAAVGVIVIAVEQLSADSSQCVCMLLIMYV
jgi:hypothetical protein